MSNAGATSALLGKDVTDRLSYTSYNSRWPFTHAFLIIKTALSSHDFIFYSLPHTPHSQHNDYIRDLIYASENNPKLNNAAAGIASGGGKYKRSGEQRCRYLVIRLSMYLFTGCLFLRAQCPRCPLTLSATRPACSTLMVRHACTLLLICLDIRLFRWWSAGVGASGDRHDAQRGEWSKLPPISSASASASKGRSAMNSMPIPRWTVSDCQLCSNNSSQSNCYIFRPLGCRNDQPCEFINV